MCSLSPNFLLIAVGLVSPIGGSVMRQHHSLPVQLSPEQILDALEDQYEELDDNWQDELSQLDSPKIRLTNCW